MCPLIQTGSTDISGGLDRVHAIYTGRASTNLDRVQTIESVLVALMVVGAFSYYIFLVSPYVGALQQVGLTGRRLPWGRARTKRQNLSLMPVPPPAGSSYSPSDATNIMYVCRHADADCCTAVASSTSGASPD